MSDLYQEAVTRCVDLFARALETSLAEPLAMTLATVGANGRAAARIVLARGFDDRGLVFYTNLNSAKADDLKANKSVALCFHWDSLKEQLRIEGEATPVSDAEADQYWRGRARDSQIGAWASRQSETLASRDLLDARIAEIEERFAGQDVPRPDFWSGFRVSPRWLEFWKARPARLHEREVYEKTPSGWTKRLLFP